MQEQPCSAGADEPACAGVPQVTRGFQMVPVAALDVAGGCFGSVTLLSQGEPSLSLPWPQDPVPSPGTTAGVYGERDEPLRPNPPPLQDSGANHRQGGWVEDGLCKTTASPPSLPRAGGREGRGAGAGTMGCTADSNSQFLVASSPPWAGAGRGWGRRKKLTSLSLFLKQGLPGCRSEHPPACACSHGQGGVAPGALAPGR